MATQVILGMRTLSLGALCFNFTALIILMHISRTRSNSGNGRYKASSAVVVTELGKLVISLVLAIREVLLPSYHHLYLPCGTSEILAHGLGIAQVGEGEIIFTRDRLETDVGTPVGTLGPGHIRRVSLLEGQLNSPTRSWSPPLSRAIHARSTSLPPSYRPLPLLPLSDLGGRDNEPHNGLPSKSPTPAAFSASYVLFGYHKLIEAVFSGDYHKTAIPATMFTVQNNLQYLAVANLSVPAYHVTSQLKILTTALWSVILLRRTLARTQWCSLCLLAFGVAIVQLQAQAEDDLNHSDYGTKGSTPPLPTSRRANHVLGFVAVFASSMSSGFASTYFERTLKQPSGNFNQPSPPQLKTGLWVRNVQLSLFGLIIAFAMFLFESQEHVWRHLTEEAVAWWEESAPIEGQEQFKSIRRVTSDFFVGFTPIVYIVIGLQISGGLLAALVMVHADNIAKNFSTSLSILLSFAASVVLFDFKITKLAMVGSGLVVLSTFLFARGQL